jgi:hypothetical protein
MNTRPIKFIILCLLSLIVCSKKSNAPNEGRSACQSSNALNAILTPISVIDSLYANQGSNRSVTLKGSITRILADDMEGDRHQRFIIRLSNGRTLLIAHNVDIGMRLTGLSVGSVVYVHGDYIWNSKGGLVHYTHHDPAGKHENGWIMVGETKYN